MGGLLHLQIETAAPGAEREQAGYFPVPGAHLYTVLHQVSDPVARVLIVGPFASERHVAYHFLVRWARYLAQNRIEVLRYDYRGTGESTGFFEETRFEQWQEDSRLVTEWVVRRAPCVPLVLHGIELGAIIAAGIFRDGFGDALLIWSPPSNANDVLRSTLKRWSVFEQLQRPSESRKTFAQFVQELDQGQSIDVDGYVWPGHLWGSSFSFLMPETWGGPHDVLDDRERPSKVVPFGKNAGTILGMPYPRNPVIKDLTPLYRESLDWITRTLLLHRGHDDSSC